MRLERPPAELKLIRHGQSIRNVALFGMVHYATEEQRAVLKGTPDQLVALTDEGLRQAKETGLVLAQREVREPHVIIHSGYRRTQQTAEHILAAYAEKVREGIRFEMCDLVRERMPGFDYEMTEAEYRAAFPYHSDYWKTWGGFLGRPPGGESIADVAIRVRLFLETVLPKYSGQTVYVVTHGGTMRAFRFLLEDWSYEDARSWRVKSDGPPSNCGISTYNWTADGKIYRQTHDEVLWKPNGA